MLWRFSRNKNGFSKRLFDLAQRYVRYFNDFNYEFDQNGERRVFEAIAARDVRVVFDVGANVGDWSRLASRYFKAATFHCFEIAPMTYAELEKNLDEPRFVTNNVGLDRDCREVVYKDYGREHSTLNTIAGTTYHDEHIAYSVRPSRVVTGDSYLAANGITQIDFLKIDVEGAEHLVIEGFRSALAERKIRIIQFEYGYANGDARFLMKDFYDLLGGYGYEIGKIGSQGVVFSKFDYRMNNFESGPNYLAVLASEREVIEALRVN